MLDFELNAPITAMPSELADDEMGMWRQNIVLTNWWIERWKASVSPLEEKLLLYFHGHFATSSRKLRYGHQMWDQLVGIRAHLLGHYPSMVQYVSTSSAMLMYLDNWRNRAGNPNENFARELLELHVLGRDNYSEQDIVENAKAWTGHGLDEQKRYYQFDARNHDDRPKTIFGETRSWDGPQTIDYMFSNSTLKVHAARHLTRRLWSFLASAEPNETLVNSLAQTFIAGNFNIRTLLRAMLMSDEFYSAPALVRSPMEWVVDLLRVTGAGTDVARPEWFLSRMGQRPFAPPSPAGWGQNDTWLSVTSEWARGDFARHLTWKIDDWGFLQSVHDMSVTDSVGHTLNAFGIGHASNLTRRTIEDYVITERGRRGWAERVNQLTLTMMTPEFCLA